MTDIITTKDLTKNELSGAKILAAFAILACLVAFLNFAQMEQKDLPEIVFTVMPTQVTDGSGLVSFGANISKLANYETKLKVEYAIDNENFQPINLTQAEIDAGSLTMAPDQEYQISDIVSDSDSANLNFVWDSKAGRQNISSDQVKIRITLAAKLKEADNSGGEIVTLPGEESENVEIDESEVILDPEVIIETNEPIPAEDIETNESVPAENIEENIFEEAINNILETIIPDAEAATLNEADEDGWSQVIAISDKFSIDNVAPQVRSGQMNLAKGEIYIYFNEKISADTPVANEQILLQNEILAESAFSWLNDFILVIALSSAEKEKYAGPIINWILQITEDNSIMDSHYNRFPGALVTLTEQKGDSLEISDEEEEEVKEEEKADEEEEEEKVEEIVIPENNKIINTRGYNKNCSFNPDELVMSAGATGQAELNLIPLDSESKYVLTANTLPNDFDVKILQPSGTGSGSINLEITAPANAAPRLYKLLIKYKDITSQSVSYVNNCVLRLTVQ